MKFIKLKEHQKSSGGSNLYIKIEDGQSLTVVPRGEIFGFRIKWVNGKAVELPETNPANFNRFKMNVIVKENDQFVARVWEYGILIYNQLAAFAEEMELTKTKIKVSRKGTSTATEWFLIPLGPINPVDAVAIESIKLNILGSSKKDDNDYHSSRITDQFNTNKPSEPPSWATEDIPPDEFVPDDSELPF